MLNGMSQKYEEPIGKKGVGGPRKRLKIESLKTEQAAGLINCRRRRKYSVSSCISYCNMFNSQTWCIKLSCCEVLIYFYLHNYTTVSFIIVHKNINHSLSHWVINFNKKKLADQYKYYTLRRQQYRRLSSIRIKSMDSK